MGGTPKTFDEFVELMADTKIVVSVGGATTAVDTGLSYTLVPSSPMTTDRPWNKFDSFDPPLDLDGLKKGLYLLNGTYEAEVALMQQLDDNPGSFAKQAARAGKSPAKYIQDLVEKLKMKEDAMAMLIQACIAGALEEHMGNPSKPGAGHPPEGLPFEAPDTTIA